MPDAEKIAAVRDALPAVGAGIYLNTGSVGPLPAETAAAMEQQANRERDVGRGSPDDIPEVLQRLAEARAAVASILTTDVSNIALTRSATESKKAPRADAVPEQWPELARAPRRQERLVAERVDLGFLLVGGEPPA